MALTSSSWQSQQLAVPSNLNDCCAVTPSEVMLPSPDALRCGVCLYYRFEGPLLCSSTTAMISRQLTVKAGLTLVRDTAGKCIRSLTSGWLEPIWPCCVEAAATAYGACIIRPRPYCIGLLCCCHRNETQQRLSQPTHFLFYFFFSISFSPFSHADQNG